MDVLYLSSLSSHNLIRNIYNKTKTNPGFAVQKFSRLLVDGIIKSGADVNVLSSPPITEQYTQDFLIKYESEFENDVKYRYVPYINIPILKHICVFLYTFVYILMWGLGRRKDKVIICDVLAVSLSMGALLASKLNRIQSVCVVTDIFGMMVEAKTFIAKAASKLNAFYVRSFDKYILLTEQMNQIVNPREKPHMVMEGLCDNSLMNDPVPDIPKASPRVVLYAGGIHERYGLKMLAEAFVKANVDNAVLVYYGSGPYVEPYKELCRLHPNLQYRGVAPNEEILNEEYKATILVNPRFSTEEFTQYSFPSKNMEFMASGTPLLTTKLPGMPIEYYPYVYLFEDESVEGFARKIRELLAIDSETLKAFGAKARNFVLTNKNNSYQGKRILDFLVSNK